MFAPRVFFYFCLALCFFTLFAFALNNQDDAVVHFFFGTTWRAPLVLVLLTVFVMGVAVGVIGMVPRWWRQRQAARRAQEPQATPTNPTPEPTVGA